MPEYHDAAPITISADCLSTFNYALYYNHVPLIRKLIITNRTRDTIDALCLTIESDCPFMLKGSCPVTLAPGPNEIEVYPRVDAAFLASLTEAVEANITVSLTDKERVAAAPFRADVLVLAYDQSANVCYHPEYITAFITPNHPAIPQLLYSASEILGKWKQPQTLEGYQRKDPARARMIAAAVYEAIRKKNIVYSEPPATTHMNSEAGQRIRTVDAVLEQRLGTCMDLSLMFASCLEAAGFHPVLVIFRGHIFTGVWLTEDGRFKSPVEDDIGELTTRVGNNHDELLFFECTSACTGSGASPEQAESAARDELTNVKFQNAIDVFQCRRAGIAPLPSRVRTANGYSVEHADLKDSEMSSVPVFKNISAACVETKKHTVTKQSLWEGKLLDLSLRNILLNLPKNNSVLQLMAAKVDEIEDYLADGEEFTIDTADEITICMHPAEDKELELPMPALLPCYDPYEYLHMVTEPNEAAQRMFTENYLKIMRELDAEAKKHKKDFPFDEEYAVKDYLGFLGYMAHEFREILSKDNIRHRLHSYFTKPEALNKTLTALYRAASNSRQENGVSSLFLGIGVVRWFEAGNTKDPHYAPLVLVPIEIVRKSAVEGFSFYRRDEETHFNTTLLEMFRRNFDLEIPGLDPLPLDDHGVDVPLIFTRVKQAIMKMPGWSFLETAVLGSFSFTQFAMWNDIHADPKALEKSTIIRSLIKGRLDETMTLKVPDETAPVYLPINVDATQLNAIRSAVAGNTFVLHGPPGTGKSQTITAMIANACAAGKSVLFVAEKMAALSVVEKRLTELGLGDFCLELHSDKANKKHVLTQLAAAMDAPADSEAASYRVTAQENAQVREQLDSYTKHLYHPLPCGLSVHDLIDQYASYPADLPRVDFTAELARSVTARTFHTIGDLIGELTAAGGAITSIAGHPLLSVGLETYTSEVRTQMPAAVSELRRTVDAVKDTIAGAASAFGFTLPLSDAGALRLSENAALMLELRNADIELIEMVRTDTADIRAYLEEAEAVEGQRRELLRSVDYDFLEMDPGTLRRDWQKASKTILGRNRAMENFLASLRSHLYQKTAFEELPALFDAVEALNLRVRHLNDTLRRVPETCRKRVQMMGSLQALEKLETSVQDLHRFPGGVRAALELAQNSAALSAAERYVKAYGEYAEARDAIDRMLSRTGGDRSDCFTADAEFCAYLEAHAPVLKDWVLYRRKRRQCVSASLLPAVEAYENGLDPARLADCVRKGLCYTLINDAVGRDSVLGGFSGATFNETVRRFKRLDEQLLQSARDEIRNRIVRGQPRSSESAAISAELNLLRKAIRSNGRNLSIRALFEMLPNTVTRICPCLLMSPNSVAQYLSKDMKPFDLVIFDEASQLPTCKALSALMRAENAVIVGDPKQMPPTSFFDSSEPETDDLALDDLDSILDDCLALGIPSLYLKWHYRSTHESLIAFSNSEFYENKMLTFPSANDKERRVSIVYTDGVFERGRTRTNPVEGAAIVEEIRRRFADPTLRGQSVGVVTFNSNQQKLIEDLLSAAYSKDSELDRWANAGPDPVFIKNLENVQGDERDAILFSVGYGPDEDGRVSMNFGPINRDGGWKRLNVAFSRARVSMTVFSSLHPEQIDLRRTSSEGVAALRDFLMFAEGRALPGAASDRDEDKTGMLREIAGVFEARGYHVEYRVGHSDFRVDLAVTDPSYPERYLLGVLLDGSTYRGTVNTRDREIAQESILKKLGWNLRRVWAIDWWDHREQEENALIKLADRLSAASRARREKEEAERAEAEAKARAEAEEAAKAQAEAEAKDAEQILSEAQSAANTQTGTESAPEVQPETKKAATAKTARKGGKGKSENADAAKTASVIPSESPAEPAVSAPAERAVFENAPETVKAANEICQSPETVSAPAETVSGENTVPETVSVPAETVPEETEVAEVALNYEARGVFRLEPYTCFETEEAVYLNERSFCAEENRAMLKARLSEIVKTEAPIEKSMLIRRLAGSFSLPLVTEAMEAAAETAIAEERFRMTKRGASCYYWNADMNPMNYYTVRCDLMRCAEDICKHEYRNAMCYCLSAVQSLDRETLFTQAAALLSFPAITPELVSVLENALKFSVNSTDIERVGENRYALAEKFR